MMIEELSKELLIQQEGMKQYESYQNKITSVENEIEKLNQEVIALTKALKKEDKDVADLEKGGLHTFYLKIRGTYEKSMNREVLEAAQAKVKLQNKQFELEDAKRQLSLLQEECEKYKDCKEKYQHLYERKLAQLLLEENDAKVEILKLMTSIENSKHCVKELKEAIQAGKTVYYKLQEVEESLDGASSCGTWDILGGGLMADMMKHSHLDEAQSSLNEVQSLMRRFRTELADVDMNLDIHIDTNGFSKFADFFFDGIFADMNMQSRIHEAQDDVTTSLRKVKEVVGHLKVLLEQEENTIRTNENKIIELVNQA
ncbi:hypothetical protein lbkm_0553 [Lachnospiraceae bacterium KM106-2]|nr:hypothetical protein lbkm_0553 [Lachnospiraceae bacterium KM106-2]